MILIQPINYIVYSGNLPIFSLITGTARYLLLKDHYINGEYLLAGDTVDDFDGPIPVGWVPSANVDPLNFDAVLAFYNAGPELTGVIRTQFQTHPVTRPVTYWYQQTPNHWVLSGIGSDQSIFPEKIAYIGRIE